MAKINNMQLVRQAYKDLAGGILYQNEDCAKWVRECIRRAGGGSHRFSGATDMFRRAGQAYALTRVNLRSMLPGELLYTYDKNTQKAEHMGMYAGNGKCLHSSQSRGGLIESDRMEQWTHAMRSKLIDYVDAGAQAAAHEPAQDTVTNTPDSDEAVALSHVRLRRTMDTSGSKNVIRQLGPGDKVRVLAVHAARTDGRTWAYVEYKGDRYTHRGYAIVRDESAQYLQLSDDAAIEAPRDDGQQAPPDDAVPLYMATIHDLREADIAALASAWPQVVITRQS